jgi:serine protease inhibitor ecotin
LSCDSFEIKFSENEEISHFTTIAKVLKLNFFFYQQKLTRDVVKGQKISGKKVQVDCNLHFLGN